MIAVVSLGCAQKRRISSAELARQPIFEATKNRSYQVHLKNGLMVGGFSTLQVQNEEVVGQLVDTKSVAYPLSQIKEVSEEKKVGGGTSIALVVGSAMLFLSCVFGILAGIEANSSD